MQDFNTKIIDEFRENQGKVGGTFAGAPILLLHHKGRKSGTERVNPLVYLPDSDHYVIFGSKGGSTKHPEWYLNLVANPDASIEVGSETIPVRAETASGAEHERLYKEQVSRMPVFGEYQARAAGRIIPAVVLTRKS